MANKYFDFRAVHEMLRNEQTFYRGFIYDLEEGMEAQTILFFKIAQFSGTW